MEEEWERRMQEVKSKGEEAVRRLKQEKEELKRGGSYFKRLELICKNSYLIVKQYKRYKVIIIFIHRRDIVRGPKF